MRQGVGGLPPLFCPSQFAMPAKGVTFRYPLLPWDGVASSYPTDATICRTGAVFAICDNGAAVHQVASGAADRLKVIQILDALQLLRVVPTWDNSRAYRVTKCCSAGGEADSAASNACGYPNAADGATPFPTFRRAVFSGSVHPCPFPCVRGCTDSTYPNIGQGWICKHSAWISAQARRHRRC